MTKFLFAADVYSVLEHSDFIKKLKSVMWITGANKEVATKALINTKGELNLSILQILN